MQDTGSGGFGVVSFGLPETALGLILLAVVVFALWRLAKFIWAVFSH